MGMEFVSNLIDAQILIGNYMFHEELNATYPGKMPSQVLCII